MSEINYLNRSCREIAANLNQAVSSQPMAVSDLIDVPTFVLLGEPGMGKSAVMNALAHERSIPCYSANQILASAHDLQGSQLLIDALDEARGSSEIALLQSINQTVNDHSLSLLGLSCRVADWQSEHRNILTARIATPRVFELLPLTGEQQTTLLQHLHINDPQGFLTKAEQHGFAELLGNPQSLIMLANATKNRNDQLPEGLTDVYDLACKQLLREHNSKHNPANHQSSSETAQLNAAGWLASVTLLSNAPLIVIAHNLVITDNETILSEIEPPDHQTNGVFNKEICTAILHSRLFRKEGNGFVFAHRTVAEHLAAHYLHNALQQSHLLPTRLLSVLLSQGYLISNLRGISGLLAALNEPMRRALLDADPAALLDYGDLTRLSPTAKEALILAMAQGEPIYQDYWSRWHTKERYRALANEGMQGFVKQWLDGYAVIKKPTTAEFIAADVLLTAIEAQELDAFWSSALTPIVQDGWSQETRRAALKAWLPHATDPQQRLNMLKWVDINPSKDLEQELRGRLLEALYPDTIAPAQILEYWTKPNDRFIGNFKMFWSDSLNEKTNDAQLMSLLDAFEDQVNAGRYSKNFGTARAYFDSSEVPDNFSSLVVRAIEIHGDEVGVDKLSTWLGWFAGVVQLLSTQNTEEAKRLTDWQKARPQTLLEVVAFRLRTDAEYGFNHFLGGLDISDPEQTDFFLEQGRLLLLEQRIESACWCVIKTVDLLKMKYSHDLHERIEQLAKQNPELSRVLQLSMTSPLEDNWEREHFIHEQQYESQRRAQQELEQRNLDTLLNDLDGVAQGRYWDYLSQTAWLEMSEHGYVGGNELFTQWQIDHPLLKTATQQGYLSCLRQLHENCLNDILKAHVEGKNYLFELPCRVAARELFLSDEAAFWALGQKTLSAVCVLELLGCDSKTDWLWAIAAQQPDWFVQAWLTVLKKYALRRKDIRIPFLHALSQDEHLKALAMCTLPEALKRWPSKAPRSSAHDFSQLLMALVGMPAHAQPVSLLIQERLSKQSLSAWQRAYLLMAGVWVDEALFLSKIETLLSAKSSLLQGLFDFVGHVRWFYDVPKTPDWSASSMAQMIRLFSPLCSSESPRGTHFITEETSVHDFLLQLIRQLSQTFTLETHQILIALSEDEHLGTWREQISCHVAPHALALAIQQYSTPSPPSIAQLLNNSMPVNHDDFMALTLDVLQQLQKDVTNNDTDLRHRFWDVDPNGQKTKDTHRPETECRNVITEWLRAHINARHISTRIEQSHGQGNQVDIELHIQPPNNINLLLPIEVKGDWHRELWTAIENQLYRKYCTDARCAGNGIYLVLWTGLLKSFKKHSINNAEQLQNALEKEVSQNPSLTSIKVFVLDISTPHVQ